MIFRYIVVLYKLFEVMVILEINVGYDLLNRFFLVVYVCILIVVLINGNV